MSIFSDTFTKIGDFFGGSDAPNTPPIPQRKPTVPSVYKNPSSQQTSAPVSSSTIGGFDLGGVGDFLNRAGKTIGGVAETFFRTKSEIEQLKTAQELEKIKLEAVTQSAKNAPAPAQVVLPTVADFIDDPRAAASQVTPSALFGSGAIQSGISSMALIIGGGVAIYMLAKR